MRRRAALSAVLLTGAVATVAAALPAGASTHPTVSYRAVPDPHIPRYDVSGKFPVIAGDPKVEAALTKAFAAWSAAYRKSAIEQEKGESGPPATYRGFFGTAGVVTAANSTYVSTIVSTERLYPGGNDGAGYFSFTALPNGKKVSISQLVSNFHDLAARVDKDLLAHNSCVREAQSGGIGFPSPTARPAEYADFAVLKSGLYLGFEQGAYAEEACGAAHSTLPWSSIQADLTPLGRKLGAAATGGKHWGKMYGNG